MYAHTLPESSQLELINAFKTRSPDIIINVAGPTSITDSIFEPEPYLQVPLSITRFLMKAVGVFSHRIIIIQVSTASVYGECELAPAGEDTDLNPLSPYAQGKLLSDYLLSQSDTDWIIVRATSIYSNLLNGRVLGRLRDGLRTSTPIALGGSGREVRDFMHIEDFAKSIIQLAGKSEARKNIFLVGSGISLQISEVARIALDQRDSRVRGFNVHFDGKVRLGDPLIMAVDITKLRSLGFSPSIVPSSGLREYFRAHL